MPFLITFVYEIASSLDFGNTNGLPCLTGSLLIITYNKILLFSDSHPLLNLVSLKAGTLATVYSTGDRCAV